MTLRFFCRSLPFLPPPRPGVPGRRPRPDYRYRGGRGAPDVIPRAPDDRCHRNRWSTLELYPPGEVGTNDPLRHPWKMQLNFCDYAPPSLPPLAASPVGSRAVFLRQFSDRDVRWPRNCRPIPTSALVGSLLRTRAGSRRGTGCDSPSRPPAKLRVLVRHSRGGHRSPSVASGVAGRPWSTGGDGLLLGLPCALCRGSLSAGLIALSLVLWNHPGV